MSFVPVTGPARLRTAVPPRDSVVEFTAPVPAGGGTTRREVALPMRAALPVLTKAHARDDAHPSVRLLAGAVLLGMRLVAAGRFEPRPVESPLDSPSWRLTALPDDDEDRIVMLARAGAHDGLDEAGAEGVVRQVLDAVVDAMPRSAPRGATPPAAETETGSAGPTDAQAGAPGPRGRSLAERGRAIAERGAARAPGRGPGRRPAPRFEERLQARLDRVQAAAHEAPAQLVRLLLRVEADEEELVAGSLRLVLQVQDELNTLRTCDAALLWTEPRGTHGFGERARTHALIALRAAAEAWPVLDRFLEMRVPDEITLETDEIVSLLDHGVGALKDRGVDVLWPRSLGRDLTSTTVLDQAAARRTPSAREGQLVEGLFGAEKIFSFQWQLAVHGDPLTPEEMDQLAASASPILKLRGNWSVVDPAMARRAKKRLVRTVTPAQALNATLTGIVEVDDKDETVVVGATLERIRERIRTAATRDPVAAPALLRAQLRDYQLHGLTWLSEMTSLGLGACLADDMGLGKTVTLIALHLHRREGGALGHTGGPTLVVCPASLMGNWEAEIRRFAPEVEVRRFHGSQRSLEGLAGSDERAGAIVLTTYGTMRRDCLPGDEAAARALGEVDWDLVVADEAQHIKNYRSSTARALRTLDCVARVALTGTPVENDLTELWSILDWAIPGLLGSRNAFRRAWAAQIEGGVDPEMTARFAALISPFLLRRRKSDPGVAPELPAKTETDHLLALTREQVVLYEAFVRDTMERIERSDEEARRGLVLALLTGLKQICNHPAQFLKQASPRLAGRSEKLDLLDELLGTVLAEGGEVLIFTQYVAMARLLETHLARTGVPHQFLHGGTPVREREAMVARFQAGEVPVFILSLKAGGTGLNLTRADHVIHLDRWWNPAVEEQATDRAYRIGQTRPVQVHRLITQGTIEERIAELLTRKRALADAVLGRGELALTELDDTELRDLVELRRAPVAPEDGDA
ncbi:DEAD/DEAH box helicase [Nocardioides pacificus]